jgi:hypothetical protein
VLECNSHGVGDLRLRCLRVTVMVLYSSGYGVRKKPFWCYRVVVMVSETTVVMLLTSESNAFDARK